SYVDPDQHNLSYKAPFLTHLRKDEVCTLVWYKVVFGLCALQVALAPKLARSYRNFGLVKLVSRTAVILYFTQNDVNAVALVGLQDIIIHEIYREHIHGRKGYDNQDVANDFPLFSE